MDYFKKAIYYIDRKNNDLNDAVQKLSNTLFSSGLELALERVPNNQRYDSNQSGVMDKVNDAYDWVKDRYDDVINGLGVMYMAGTRGKGNKPGRQGDKVYDSNRGAYVGTKRRPHGASDMNQKSRDWSEIKDPIERAKAIVVAANSKSNKPSSKEITRARKLLGNQR
jgi:hypothetical protein